MQRNPENQGYGNSKTREPDKRLGLCRFSRPQNNNNNKSYFSNKIRRGREKILFETCPMATGPGRDIPDASRLVNVQFLHSQ